LPNSVEIFYINGGLLQVKDNNVIILADEADEPADLVKEEIEEAIKLA
jgi:F0F1-type ATP synthase epsilon subunit